MTTAPCSPASTGATTSMALPQAMITRRCARRAHPPRYSKLADGEGELPDALLIDGGTGPGGRGGGGAGRAGFVVAAHHLAWLTARGASRAGNADLPREQKRYNCQRSSGAALDSNLRDEAPLCYHCHRAQPCSIRKSKLILRWFKRRACSPACGLKGVRVGPTSAGAGGKSPRKRRRS